VLWPARDAEVLSAVERVLRRVHETRDRQRLDLKLSEANQELQRRDRKLAAIINIGKAVVSIVDQRVLFQKIIDGLIQVSDANIAWMLIRDEDNKQFLLAAQQGLPKVWAKKVNMPLDDGICGLVALSGETLCISGEPLLRFRVANLGKSVCVVPIKIQKEVIGMLVVVRQDAHPVDAMEQTLLEAIADYASISLLNARLFRALNNSRQISKDGERGQNALLDSVRGAIVEEVQPAIQTLDTLLGEKIGNLSESQRQALQIALHGLQRLARIAARATPPSPLP
jgi:transcriptional regulator with GAF, ATPase, and Fis domain